MYLWALHSADTSVPPAVRGITDDLDRAMRVTEPYLIEERALLCRIVQVRYAMTVTSMDACYVPTGRAWNGGRDDHGGVTWQETETQVERCVRMDACDYGSSRSPSRAPATPRSARWRPPRKPLASTGSSAPIIT